MVRSVNIFSSAVLLS